MEQSGEVKQVLFDAFSSQLLERGWSRLGCAEIAAAANIDVAQAFDVFSNRYAYVTYLVRRIDRDMIAQCDSDVDDETARDRLFDVLMARFEAMQAYRPIIETLTEAAKRDPLLAFHLVALTHLTADWIMEMARISPVGLRGQVRAKGMLAAYARTFKVWLGDDSEDLAKTMAFLDKTLTRAEATLRRAEKVACTLPRLRKRCKARWSRKDRAEEMPKATGSEAVATPADEPPFVDDGGVAPMPT